MAYDSNEAAAIASLCADCGVPHMTASLLREGVSLDQAKTRVSAVGTVRIMVAIARQKEPSIEATIGDTMLAAGQGVEAIRAELFERIVAAEDVVGDINSHTPLPMGATDHARMAARASMERTLREQGMEPKPVAAR